MVWRPAQLVTLLVLLARILLALALARTIYNALPAPIHAAVLTNFLVALVAAHPTPRAPRVAPALQVWSMKLHHAHSTAIVNAPLAPSPALPANIWLAPALAHRRQLAWIVPLPVLALRLSFCRALAVAPPIAFALLVALHAKLALATPISVQLAPMVRT